MNWSSFKFLLVIVFSISLFTVAGQGINQTDDNNRKQGHWKFTNKIKKLPGYGTDQLVEEGYYENNRKVGTWTFYFNNGKIKHTLTYLNNQPNGPAKFYYKSGKVREEGVWKNNRWVGNYKQYYPNGNLKNNFNYNNQGTKSGKQEFFHENGNLMITGTWTNGEEGNDIHEYNKDGSPNTERYTKGPELKPVQNQKPKIKKTTPVVKRDTIKHIKDPIVVTEKAVTKVKKSTKPKTPFNGNGFHEFKDRYGRNIRVGTFKNGYLQSGKTFEYDKKGNIKTTKIIEDGKVIKIINGSDNKKQKK